MIQRKVHKTGLWATTILLFIVLVSFYAIYKINMSRHHYAIEYNIIPEHTYHGFSEYTCIDLYSDSTKQFWWKYEEVDTLLQKISTIPESSQITFLKHQNYALREFCVDMTTQHIKIYLNLRIHKQSRVKQFIDILDELIVTNKALNNTSYEYHNVIDISSESPKYSILYRVLDYTPSDDSLIKLSQRYYTNF